MKKRDNKKPTASDEINHQLIKWRRNNKRKKIIKVAAILATIILVMFLSLYILTLSGSLVLQGGIAGIFKKGDKNMAGLSPDEVLAIPMYRDRVLLNPDKSINVNYFYDIESKFSPVNPKEYLPPELYSWTMNQVKEAKTDRWYYKGLLNDVDLFKKYLSEGFLNEEEFYLIQRFFRKIFEHPLTFDTVELFLTPEDRAYIKDIYAAYKQCEDQKEFYLGIQNLHNSTLYPKNGFEGVSYQAAFIGARYYEEFDTDNYLIVSNGRSDEYFPFTDAAGDTIHLFQIDKISADHLQSVIEWGQSGPQE